MRDIKFAVCHSVCLGCIPSKTAQRIWLSFPQRRKSAPDTTSHVLVVIAPGVLPREPKMYHIVSVLHRPTCLLCDCAELSTSDWTGCCQANSERLQRPASLDSSAAALPETKSSSPKICKSKFRKSVPQFCVYWHVDHVCQVSWKPDKNCRRCDDLKKVWRDTQNIITYTTSSAGHK